MTTQERARELAIQWLGSDAPSLQKPFIDLLTRFAASERLEEAQAIYDCWQQEFTDHWGAWLKQRIAALERTAKGESQ